MKQTSRQRLTWASIVLLSLPALALFGISILHPGVPSQSGIAVVKAAQVSTTSVAAPTAPWTLQESDTTASLRGIYAVDNRIAWASGTAGTVLKTVDGGSHWTICATPSDAQTLDFRGIQAWDASQAIVMASGPGDKSRLYKTTDGCKTWNLLFKNPDMPDGFFDSFFADWSEETGTPTWSGSLLGDPVHGKFVVYDTTDSGATWTRRKSAGLDLGDPALGGSSLGGFAASNSLFPGNQENTHNPRIFASGGKSGAVLWIEKLPEQTWRKVSLPMARGSDSTGIFSVASHGEKGSFRNVISTSETMVAVGGDYAKPTGSAGTAAWSADGGLTWTAAAKPPRGYRSSVAWSDKLNAWIAVGTNGSDISQDEGKTWTAFDEGNWNAVALPWVVGPKGRIAKLSSVK